MNTLAELSTVRLQRVLSLLTESPNGDAGCVALAVRIRVELERRSALTEAPDFFAWWGERMRHYPTFGEAQAAYVQLFAPFAPSDWHETIA